MGKIEKYNIIVAENAPILSAGFVHTLRRISSPHLNVNEAGSLVELQRLTRSSKIDFLLVSPTFGGIFDPVRFKRENDLTDIKIMAIEIGKLSSQAVELYDGVVHVTDDFETVKKKIISLCDLDPQRPEDKEALSSREKEIISLVVKGLTNQEIADKLFLSIHTVITHRRNIARKLEIHSATGLTIYAIVNKIVNLEDVVK